MKSIRKILLGLAVLLIPVMAHSTDNTRTQPVNLNAAAATEANVAVSATANTTVLAANANRADFDIFIATCINAATTSTKIYYSYDGSFTVVTASSTPAFWIDQTDFTGANGQFFRKPMAIMPTGAIVAQAETAGCVVTAQEWSNTSPLWQ